LKERLQKLISACGVASRRTAEKMIAEGRVSVNGVVASLGDLADMDRDRIECDGVLLKPAEKLMYIMLNKPRGYVTTLSDEKGRRTVLDLVRDCGARVYPVGRLDLNSEGLLLMTNDGALANRLTHPSFQVDKRYLAWVVGDIAPALPLLRRPMDLDGEKVGAAKVRTLSGGDGQGLLEFTIHEGKNRQVRRMCRKAGLRVTRLKRIAEGALTLGDLPPGKWRELSGEEIRLIEKGDIGMPIELNE